MHILLDNPKNNAIQAYTDSTIQINNKTYKKSLIASAADILDFPYSSLGELGTDFVEKMLALQPEIIIVGHSEAGKFLPVDLQSELSRERIGIECMSLGAACRTYNILLSELRAVFGVFILPG